MGMKGRHTMKKILARLLSHCDHPMIRQSPDGRWYCTECGAQVG